MSKGEMICVGVIAAPKGLKGEVRVRSFTSDPRAIGDYGPLSDEAGGRHYTLKVTGQTKAHVIARIKGVDDRNGAEALKGQKLFIARSALPKPEEDEFYYTDLVGLAAEHVDGSPFGAVRAVEDFGAGVMLDVLSDAHGALLVPFTREAVPVVDIKGGRLVVDPPAGLLEKGTPEEGIAADLTEDETQGTE